MNVVDSTTLIVDLITPSMVASVTPSHAANAIANTLRQQTASNVSKAEGALRDAPERNERQVLAAAAMLDDQLDHCTGPSPNERVRPGAGRSSQWVGFLAANVVSLRVFSERAWCS